MKILNLTQHVATPEQIAAGVVEPSEKDKKLIIKLLTFEEIPEREEIFKRADLLARLARRIGYRNAMVGGAPYLMRPLESALWRYGIRGFYAFSKRESIEEQLPDGSVKKTQVFRHAGFVLSTFWGGRKEADEEGERNWPIWEGWDRPLQEWIEKNNEWKVEG